MLIGYARTSTVEQVAGLEAQEAALAATGCTKVFREQASSVGQRDQLDAALDFVREGDTLVVTRLDRLARSTADLLSIVALLERKQVALRILDFGGTEVDTRSPTGRMLLRTLWNHFLDGSGDTVCLTRSQFSDLASADKRVGNLAPKAGGGYAQQTSYYGGDYANSFGTATLYLDGDRNATGFHDFYNFDAHGRTSVGAQAKTAIGALGYLAGGKDFSVDYNNGDCR